MIEGYDNPWIERRPICVRIRSWMRFTFTLFKFHRLLTRWHLWSPWKLIPYAMFVGINSDSLVKGDLFYDPVVRQTYKVLKKGVVQDTMGFVTLCAQLPPINVAWRWDKREYILGGFGGSGGGVTSLPKSFIEMGNSL